MAAACGGVELALQWDKNFRAPVRKTLWHHADYFVRFTVENELAAENAAVGVEALLPEGMREHHQLGAARPVFLFGVPAADGGMDAKNIHQ